MVKLTSSLTLLILIGLGLGLMADEGQPDPLDLLECARENWVGDTFHGTIVLQLFRPEYSREYRMEVWVSAGGEPAFVRVLEPEEEAGSGYLFLEDAVWRYDAESGQVIRLLPSFRSEEFFGDLTPEDLYRGTLSEDYEVELLGTPSTEEGDRIHRLRLTPKPEAPVVYGKLELDIRDSDCAVLRIKYYDQRGSLIRRATFSDFVRIEGENSRVVPLKTVVDDFLVEGSRTVEIIETYQFGISIPPERFTEACLVEGGKACGLS